MLNIHEISERPTTWSGEGGVHESIFRSHWILQTVKELLKKDCPSEIVLDLIEDMEIEDMPQGA